MKIIIVLCVILVSFCQPIHADDTGDTDTFERGTSPRATVEAHSEDGMPPVLPGQVLEVEGRRMKVWSTGGGVSVGAVPTPGHLPNNSEQVMDSMGIIIDRRPR